MRTELFEFDLPKELIALRPAVPRDSARLLVVHPANGFTDSRLIDLPDVLHRSDQLVVNDTKVVPASLQGRRLGRDNAEPRIEALLHRRIDGARWSAFVKPARKLKVGDVVRFGDEGKVCFLNQLDATVEAKGEGGEVTFAFTIHGPWLDQAVAERGLMPLPPYITARRPADAQDLTDYQTMFARDEGSVAAPTAGLHFTPSLVTRLQARGVGLHHLTLHVGAGTFLPVKVDDTSEHRMHAEAALLTAETADALQSARDAGSRIVAVGTTSLRLLESAAVADGRLRPFRGETSLFITPGYRFQAVDLLLTNFHLPRSTLFMLVCAFAGLDLMKQAYAHALAQGYRFYSYGDACLLTRAKTGPDY
jgi:S-adenosylmethionine:tRNA ribosyltransferase-isomerase